MNQSVFLRDDLGIWGSDSEQNALSEKRDLGKSIFLRALKRI